MPFPTHEDIISIGWSPYYDAAEFCYDAALPTPRFNLFPMQRWLLTHVRQQRPEMAQLYPSDREGAWWISLLVDRPGEGRIFRDGLTLTGPMSPRRDVDALIRELFGRYNDDITWYSKRAEGIWVQHPWTDGRAHGLQNRISAPPMLGMGLPFDDGGGVPGWIQFLTETPYSQPTQLGGTGQPIPALIRQPKKRGPIIEHERVIEI